MENQGLSALPGWVPEAAGFYLAHTEAGQTIRNLARHRSCHASTILRQIRKVERLRDDPLVDAALSLLAKEHFAMHGQTSLQTEETGETKKEDLSMTRTQVNPDQTPDESTFETEALRILRQIVRNRCGIGRCGEYGQSRRRKRRGGQHHNQNGGC